MALFDVFVGASKHDVRNRRHRDFVVICDFSESHTIDSARTDHLNSLVVKMQPLAWLSTGDVKVCVTPAISDQNIGDRAERYAEILSDLWLADASCMPAQPDCAHDRSSEFRHAVALPTIVWNDASPSTIAVVTVFGWPAIVDVARVCTEGVIAVVQDPLRWLYAVMGKIRHTRRDKGNLFAVDVQRHDPVPGVVWAQSPTPAGIGISGRDGAFPVAGDKDVAVRHQRPHGTLRLHQANSWCQTPGCSTNAGVTCCLHCIRVEAA